MLTIKDLIKDEREAITAYKAYLAQGVKNPKMIPVIKKIIRDEEDHIRFLNKLEKLRAI